MAVMKGSAEWKRPPKRAKKSLAEGAKGTVASALGLVRDFDALNDRVTERALAGAKQAMAAAGPKLRETASAIGRAVKDVLPDGTGGKPIVPEQVRRSRVEPPQAQEAVKAPLPISRPVRPAKKSLAEGAKETVESAKTIARDLGALGERATERVLAGAQKAKAVAGPKISEAVSAIGRAVKDALPDGTGGKPIVPEQVRRSRVEPPRVRKAVSGTPSTVQSARPAGAPVAQARSSGATASPVRPMQSRDAPVTWTRPLGPPATAVRTASTMPAGLSSGVPPSKVAIVPSPPSAPSRPASSVPPPPPVAAKTVERKASKAKKSAAPPSEERRTSSYYLNTIPRESGFIVRKSGVTDVSTGAPIARMTVVERKVKGAGPPKTPVAPKKEKVWSRDKWGKWDWR